MRLLLINPNTSPDITARVADVARAAAPTGLEISTATGRFGARYIASRAAAAIAGHGVLDAYAEHGHGVDMVGLACFGDPGLLALRELASVPVVGMAEASCHAACHLGRRFAIVTGGERWGPMLEEFVASLGLSDRLAGVATVAPSGADIARDPDGSRALLAAACSSAVETQGADVVILGGAGLAGMAAPLAASVRVPLVDSTEALVATCVAIHALAPAKATTGTLALTPPVGSVGLSAQLTARLAGEH